MGSMKSDSYWVGLEFGLPNESTALAVLQRPWVDEDTSIELRRPAYSLRHLERFPLGTSYLEIIRSLIRVLQAKELCGCNLIVDRTGVGQAVIDLVLEQIRSQVCCWFFPVLITNGIQVEEIDGMMIPKQELVSTLQILLQTKRLKIPKELPESILLVRELENFTLKRTVPSTTDPLVAWREGQHDDLIFAVGIAAWVAEQNLPSLEPPRKPVRRIRIW
jgi:hypothetical protein